MKLTIKKVLVAATVAWATASQAAPVQYDFQYTTSDAGGALGVLAGSLIGELQADGNTIVVSSVLDFVTFNGVDGVSLPFVDSYLEFLGGPPADPTVSLDGSVMDFIACKNDLILVCDDGFWFDSKNKSYSTGPSFGFIAPSAPYDAGSWQIQAVPEPGSLALVGLALAGLGAMRRRA